MNKAKLILKKINEYKNLFTAFAISYSLALITGYTPLYSLSLLIASLIYITYIILEILSYKLNNILKE
jgi:hypothetical protein